MLFTNPLLCVNRRKGSKNKRITNFFGNFFGLGGFAAQLFIGYADAAVAEGR